MPRPSLNDRINGIVEGVEEALSPGDVDPEDIRIPAPKEPEVNPEIYRDVESLLFRGFLILPAEINGVRFLFKSINHREFEYLQWTSGTLGGMLGKSMDRYYSAFMAYGVFMIDGQNILPDRDQWLPKLQDVFSGFPVGARGKIIRYLSEVNSKAAGAVTLTEAYQMESYSRFRWAQYRGLDPMSSTSTGILGTDRLGLNFSQLVWRALNYYEDTRDSAEREWDNAKFIGSCFAGKGIQKIYNQDKDRRQKERDERVKRRDQLIRQVVLREDPDKVKDNGRYVMKVARSVEELADQLEKNLRGEKDWHDEVVAREEARLKSELNSRQKKLQEIAKERDLEQASPYTATSDLTGLTREEVAQRIQRKRQLEAQQAASRVVYPEMMDERMEGFLQKHLADQDETYQDRAIGTTNRDPSVVLPLPPPRQTAIPFRR
jgi:hypothetical protein